MFTLKLTTTDSAGGVQGSLLAYFDDFERWCEECIMITDKLSGQPIPFRLNAPQRRLARIMERQRLEGKPVRIILLKARQWGGSTLVQAYLAWHQLVRAKGRNALVCAHVKDAAALIRSTYSQLLDMYPEEMKTPDSSQWKLKPYQQTQGMLWIPARRALLAIASANNPDSLRGASYHLAHLSEAAFWADGDTQAASAIVRTVCGSIPSERETVVVIESTADGADNWFAAEWRRAVAGKSDKTPVFVPWHEIEIYRKRLTARQRTELPARLTDYELRLLGQGVQPEAVAWYHDKRREYSTDAEMMAEFPTTPEEAFSSSAASPFAHVPMPLIEPEETSELSPVLIVAAIGTSLRLVEFAVADGKICTLREHEADSPESLMKQAAIRLAEASGASFAIIEAPVNGHPRHGRWCLRYARRHTLNLCYTAEEPLLTLTEDLGGELIDLQCHLLGEGRLAEPSAEACELYRCFHPRHPHRAPRLLARMAASALLEHLLTSTPASPQDFM